MALALLTATPVQVGTEEIIRVLRLLPSAPKILPRLLEILKDDNASIGDVVDLVKVDPGMASRVLQIANSAYYTPAKSSQCPSMEEAISRVGLVKVYELVAVAATTQLLMRPLQVYGLSPEDMWLKSVTCAIAAERLALRFHLDLSTSYTSGLLHCVGLVAIDAWAEVAQPQLRLAPGVFPDESSLVERQSLSLTNAAVAGALLRHWGFPSTMIDPIRWQYAPTHAGYHQKMATVIYLAKWLRDAASLPAEAPPPAAPPAAILEIFRCSEDDLTELLPDIRESLERANLLLAEPPAEEQ